MASLFAAVKKWRARDEHTGIGKAGGVPYTYRHAIDRRQPKPVADVYRIETYIPFVAPTPIHCNVYYVPGSSLDRFFEGWGEHAETVIDIRPLSAAEALEEIALFRARAEGERKAIE